jgi:hypothetical protein
MNAKGHEGRRGQQLPQLRQHHARKLRESWTPAGRPSTLRRDS